MSRQKESDILGRIIILPVTETSRNSDELLVTGDIEGIKRFLCPVCILQSVVNETCDGPHRCYLGGIASEVLVCDVPEDLSFCFRVAVDQSLGKLFSDDFLNKYFNP